MQFCGIEVNDGVLELVKEIALPMMDDDPTGASEGLCLSTIRDIIEGGLDKQGDEELLAALSKHVLSSYKAETWPPPYVFFLIDDEDADDNGDEDEDEHNDFYKDNEEDKDRAYVDDKKEEGEGPREEVMEIREDDVDSQYSEGLVLVRTSEEETRAKQEEEDRLLAKRIALLHEQSMEMERQLQEDKDADVARQLEAEDIGNLYDGHGFSNDDAVFKLDRSTCMEECREFLRANGSGLYYSQPFADCVVDIVFTKHPDALKALEQQQYLLDAALMNHVCSSLLWRTMSSKVEPCKYALKKEVCYLANCDKEHYLSHFPCKHWIQPTGCHQYLRRDANGDSLCPFGHDTSIFDDDELEIAFAEAAASYQPDTHFEADYRQFLTEEYLDSGSDDGEENFPAKFPSSSSRPVPIKSRNKRSQEGHVTELISAFKFDKASSSSSPSSSGGIGKMAKMVTDDDMGSTLHSQNVRVRDFTEGESQSQSRGRVKGNSEAASKTRKQKRSRSRNRVSHVGVTQDYASFAQRSSELRAPCLRIWEKKKKLILASQGAFQHGHRAQASVLAKEAKDMEPRYQAELRQAALSIFWLGNADETVLNEGVVDLHGLYVKEAQYILHSLLCSGEGKLRAWTANNCANRVKIVTGAGRHSEGGVLRLLPAIKDLLDSGALSSKKLKYKEMRDGTGAVFGLQVDVTPLIG